MHSYRRLGIGAAAVAALAYGAVALVGPQGFFSLRDKYREIRRLEMENSELERSNREMSERIQKVLHSESQREVEVKSQLKYSRPNELRFVLPDSTSNARPAAQQQRQQTPPQAGQ